MSNNMALTTVGSSNASLAHRTATDVAGAIKEFATQRVVVIGGKKYPPVEVWQAVANGFGCVAAARDVEIIEGGIRAIGEVRRISDGTVIACGEGFVGDDEKTWASRPMFARRAMAQTRAISRACRSAFAFVIPLIEVGLETTPAEEMDGVHAAAEHHASRPAATTTARAIPTGNVDILAFEDRLVEVKIREGQSARGPWRAAFLHFNNREEEPGTFDAKLIEVCQSLQGTDCAVNCRPGKKPGSWELIGIKPADDVPN